MSGGHFDYKQDEIGRIADSLEDELYSGDVDSYGYRRIGLGALDPDNSIKNPERMREYIIASVKVLRLAEILTHRFDWLISADDGEDSFYERLKDDLVRAGLWDAWHEWLMREGVDPREKGGK